MRDTKTLLELLLKSFSEDRRVYGLCYQITKISNTGLISQEEENFLLNYIKTDMENRFQSMFFAFEKGCTLSEKDAIKNKPKRIDWICKMIKEQE